MNTAGLRFAAKWGPPARAILCGSIALALLVSGGCGYRVGGPYRTEIGSVHVAMFESREFRRGLEFDLTEALKKRISANTPYRVADASRADSALSGEVLEVRQTAFAPDPRTRIPRDATATLIVRVTWKDLRDGRLLMDDELRLDSVDYLRAAGESEPYALQKAVDGLADRIVQRMAEDW